MLAEALDAGFSGRSDPEEALAGYQQRRDETAGPIYALTAQVASFEPPPPMIQEVIHALPGNQPAMNQFLGVLARTVPFGEFFAPDNLQAILAARQ